MHVYSLALQGAVKSANSLVSDVFKLVFNFPDQSRCMAPPPSSLSTACRLSRVARLALCQVLGVGFCVERFVRRRARGRASRKNNKKLSSRLLGPLLFVSVVSGRPRHVSAWWPVLLRASPRWTKFVLFRWFLSSVYLPTRSFSKKVTGYLQGAFVPTHSQR